MIIIITILLTNKKMRKVGMSGRWKTVKIREALVTKAEKEVEQGPHPNLSQFISEAVRIRLQTLDVEQKLKTRGQLRYTPKHVWIKHISKNPHVGNIKLGVSGYWERMHKGIVFIGNFEVGDEVSKNTSIGTIETVAWWPWIIHDIVSPINGKINKVNKAVLDNPYLLYGNPHQWIVEIQPTNPDDVEPHQFLSYEEYKKLKVDALERKRATTGPFRWQIKQRARNDVYSNKFKKNATVVASFSP
jgi:glycine cleavage system H protein